MTKTKRPSFRVHAPRAPRVPKIIEPKISDYPHREPDSLTQNLAVLPEKEASRQSLAQSLGDHSAWCSLHREGKTCDCDWFVKAGGTTERAIIVGVDLAKGEDLSTMVVCEREADGSIRVVSVTTWTALTKENGDVIRMRPVYNEIVMRGWKCPTCGVFRGEEKETVEACSCGQLRPLLKREEVSHGKKEQGAHRTRPDGTKPRS